MVQHFFYSTGLESVAPSSTPRKLSVQYRKWSISTSKTKECLRALILFSICLLGNKIWKNISNYSFLHHFLALNKLHRHFRTWKKINKNVFRSLFSSRLVARQPPRIMTGSCKYLRVMHSS